MKAMMDQAGVTIAIPNFNHEVLLPRSIRSALRAMDVLRAEGWLAEVLVIDEGSRDGSSTLLRQLEALYCKDGLRCLMFGATAPIAVTRNEAARQARYRYLAFLDADNELVPENLPLFVRTLEQTGAAAAYGNLLLRSTTADYAHYMHSCESIQKRLFRGGNYVDMCSVWDRFQILDSGGFESNLNFLEDLEMWLHLATNGRRIVFVPAILGYYYLLPAARSNDLSKQDAVEVRLMRIFNQLKVRDFLPLNTDQLRYHPELGYI
jgi:glycosyltransferase involved in cell wall biosynthesis